MKIAAKSNISSSAGVEIGWRSMGVARGLIESRRRMALNIVEMRPGTGYLTCCFGNPIYRQRHKENDISQIISTSRFHRAINESEKLISYNSNYIFLIKQIGRPIFYNKTINYNKQSTC